MPNYKLQQKTDANNTMKDLTISADCIEKDSSVTQNSTKPVTSGAVFTALSSYVPTTRTINSKVLSSNITLESSDVNALPSYSKSISTSAGNPREVKFVRVNYATFDGNNAAYFRIGAMCSHGNGSSYTFLEDIIIGVSATPSVTCTVYKQVQNTSTFTVDSHTVYFGDVYWVVNTNDKYVDFYIICGQYATINFTPFMKIGNTVSDTSKIVQYTGSATLYSSGTRVWDTIGNGSLYALKSDIPTNYVSSLDGNTGAITLKTINSNSLIGSGDITINSGLVPVGYANSRTQLTSIASTTGRYLICPSMYSTCVLDNGGTTILQTGFAFVVNYLSSKIYYQLVDGTSVKQINAGMAYITSAWIYKMIQ